MKKIDQLLIQLKQISPLPDDSNLTKELLDRYDSVVTEVISFRDKKTISPLIDSFGYGEGFGIYWKIVHFLEEFEADEVDPVLIQKLAEGTRGTKLWAAYMLGRSRNKKAVDNLILLLQNENELVKSNAATALGMIGDIRAKTYLEKLKNDNSEEVKNAVYKALESLSMEEK